MAWTKRGAGSVRRAGIQILSDKLSPLSVGQLFTSETDRTQTVENGDALQRSPDLTMAAHICLWIASFLISSMTSDAGLLGRSLDSVGFPSQSTDGPSLRVDLRRRGAADAHRERCAKLSAPWLENARRDPGDDATLLRLRVRPFTTAASGGLVFPEKSLFSFIRLVYRCCQQRVSCRSVKGIQGRFRGGKASTFTSL